MSVKLLTEHHFEFLSLKGGCMGLSESIIYHHIIIRFLINMLSTLVKRPHSWKSYVPAHFTSSFKQIGISNRFLVKKVSMTRKCHKSRV